MFIPFIVYVDGYNMKFEDVDIKCEMQEVWSLKLKLSNKCTTISYTQ